MTTMKNGARAYYKALCAVIFFIFCFIYIYFYQTDVLAAAQHIASGGKTQYEPILGTALIIIALKLLQNGIQAIVRLKDMFFALTYLPSFLILTIITDLPSGPDPDIEFGAWKWAFPLLIILWLAIVYIARQYQSIELDTRKDGFLSQVMGINLTIMLVMMLVVCGIGNHNRLFHRRMHVENLISRGEYNEAQEAAKDYDSKDYGLTMLRAYALARQGLIGDSLFNAPMDSVYSIIPSKQGPYTVIISKDNMLNTYKRSADWQLCELLVRKNLDRFYNNLVGFYGLGAQATSSDSTNSETANKKAQAKLNAYKDSLLSVKYKNLPKYYKEALVVYNSKKSSGKNSFIKQNYLDENMVKKFEMFQRTPPAERKEKFKGTYWLFFSI